MLGDEALAKDTLQESLIKIWKNAGAFDSKKSRLFTWMLRIARNTAIDRLKREGNQNKTLKLSQDSNVQASLNPNQKDIRKHIDRLDGKYSKVIFALFFNGLTQEEVGEALEIPVGTVKSRLRIGLQELKTIYQDPLVLLVLTGFWM